jgi:hypothetical protein
MLNLDTHIAVALLDGSLNDEELALVASQPLAISAIVLWGTRQTDSTQAPR